MKYNLQPIDIYSKEYNKNRSLYEDTFDLNIEFPSFYEEIKSYIQTPTIKKWMHDSRFFTGRFCLYLEKKKERNTNIILSYPVFFQNDIDNDTCFVIPFDRIQQELFPCFVLKKVNNDEFYEIECYDRKTRQYSNLIIRLKELCKLCNKKREFFVDLDWQKELKRPGNCIRIFFLRKKLSLCLIYDAIVRKTKGIKVEKSKLIVDQDMFKIMNVHHLNCFAIVNFTVSQFQKQKCFYQLQNEIKECKIWEMYEKLNILKNTKFTDPVFGWACYPFCFKKLKHLEDMLNIRVKWLEVFS